MNEITEVGDLTIKVTDNHHIVIISLNQQDTESLKYRLGENIGLTYSSDGNNQLYYLIVESIEKKVYLRIPIEVSGRTTNWLDLIDGGKFTDLWFGYHDTTGKVCLFGQSIKL